MNYQEAYDAGYRYIARGGMGGECAFKSPPRFDGIFWQPRKFGEFRYISNGYYTMGKPNKVYPLTEDVITSYPPKALHKCRRCGEFTTNTGYCDACRIAMQQEFERKIEAEKRPKRDGKIIAHCVVCGMEFLAQSYRHICCSDRCRQTRKNILARKKRRMSR